MVAGEEDAATGGDVKEEAEERQQLSISLETKMPPDVVAAVLATKTGSVAEAARKVEKIAEGEEEEKERRGDVDESLTISMLVDEGAEGEAEGEQEKSRPTLSSKVQVHAHADAYGNDEGARIEDWVATTKRQNCQRASSMVYYDEAMPSLDDLLAAREGWSQEFLDEALTTTTTRSGSDGDTSAGATTIDPDLDLTFEEYAEVICALLGVPVYKGTDGATSSRSLIQSLHLAMSLFLEVRQTAEQDDIF